MPSAILDAQHLDQPSVRASTCRTARAPSTALSGHCSSNWRSTFSREVAEMVERRAGLDGHPQTLAEIAHDFRLTKERIRQKTKRAVCVLRIRWPEGRYLLDHFYDILRGSYDAQEQADLVRRAADIFFGLDFEHVKAASHGEIHDAWDKLGREKRTPMTEHDIRTWLACQLPHVAADGALAWVSKIMRLFTRRTNGDAVYFTQAPHDRLLHELQTSHAQMTLTQAAEIIGGDERNVRKQLDNDPRSVSDESGQFRSRELFLCEGRWRLASSRSWEENRRDRASGQHLPAESLAAHLHGPLEGVSDATVWGVHRYANKVLRQMRYGELPAEVSPFILASKLVSHSDGLIDVMRRRRLRWDGGGAAPPARGKFGWIVHVVAEAAMPMTARELQAPLRTYYQDYDWDVILALDFDEQEDGEHYCGVRVLPGDSHYLPAIISPCDWELDVAQENVSEGIKLLVAKIIAIGKKRTYPKKLLEDAPWLVELVDRHCDGKMKWSDEAPPRGGQKRNRQRRICRGDHGMKSYTISERSSARAITVVRSSTPNNSRIGAARSRVIRGRWSCVARSLLPATLGRGKQNGQKDEDRKIRKEDWGKEYIHFLFHHFPF